MPTGIIGCLKRLFWTLKSLKNINIFLFDYLGKIKNKDLIYRTRNGLKIVARAGTADKSEIVLIFSDTEYPKKYFPQKQKPIIVDIGAHIGCFSLYIASESKNINPKIFSIEPSVENFKYLRINNRLNKSGLRCFNLAIGERTKVGYLNTQKGPDSFYIDETTGVKKNNKDYQKCQIVTLEDFCYLAKINRIDLLKLDCEGSEYKILRKSMGFIKKNVENIIIELHNTDLHKINVNKVEKLNKFVSYMQNNNFGIKGEIFPAVFCLTNLLLSNKKL